MSSSYLNFKLYYVSELKVFTAEADFINQNNRTSYDLFSANYGILVYRHCQVIVRTIEIKVVFVQLVQYGLDNIGSKKQNLNT